MYRMAYEASAGAGKTRILTQKYVETLRKIREHFPILAITFTNEAANEMKERVVRILKEEGEDELLKKVLEEYSLLRIQTIDSFLTHALAVFSLEQGIPPGFDIMVEEEGAEEKQALWDEFFEEVFNNPGLRNEVMEIVRRKGEEGGSFRVDGEIEKAVHGIMEKEIFFGDGEEMLRRIEHCEFEGKEREVILRMLPFMRIYLEFSRRFRERKKEKNLVDFNDIVKWVREILKEGEIPYFYYRIGGKIGYVLIDEFQDTSRLQWEALKPIVENVLSEGGGFLYVGDPKQAIYGFRGGESRLFYEVKDEFPHDIKHEFLPENHRSRKEIVEFLNELTGYWFEGTDPQIPRRGEGGYVEINLEDIPPEEWLVERIKKVHDEGIPYSSIMCLLRNHSKIREMSAALRKAGIPCVSGKSVSILEEQAVKEILALLKVIVDPEDRVSESVFLHSPFVKGGEDAEDRIKKARDMEKESSVYRLISRVLELLNAEEVYPESVPAFQRLLEAALDFEKSGGSTTRRFIEYLEWHRDKYTLPSYVKKEGVRMMTMHSAKGLEADVVFVVLPWKMGGTQERMKYIKDEDIFWYGTSGDCRSLYERWKKEQLEEEKRVWYVAFSRARERLYVKGIFDKLRKDGKKMRCPLVNDLLKDFMQGEKVRVWGKEVPIEIEKPEEEIVSFRIKEVKKGYAGRLEVRDDELLEPSVVERELEGERIHEVLRFFTFLEDENPEELPSCVREVVEKPELSFIFSREGREKRVYNEKEICYKKGILRPDRVVWDGERIYVVDYKTGSISDEDRKTLSLYGAALSSLFPGMKVSLYFLHLPSGELEELSKEEK